MSTRDEAVEAMAEAMDTAYSPDRYPIMTAMFRDYADTALDAALAVLHPTVPNTTDALDALPLGTVIRGDEGSVWTRKHSGRHIGRWTGSGSRPGVRTVDLVNIGTYKQINSWQVLWIPTDHEDKEWLDE